MRKSAADAQDPAWPSSDSHAVGGQKGIDGSVGETGGNNVEGGDTPAHPTFLVEGFNGVLP
jgi:hypothetical protein